MVTPRLNEVDYKVEFSECLNCFIHFEVHNEFRANKADFIFQKATKLIDIESEEIELNPYAVLSKTLLKLKKLGVLE